MAGSEKKRKNPFTRLQAACAAGGILLYMVMELSYDFGGAFKTAEQFKRADPGSGDTSYEFLVSGLDKEEEHKKIPIKISVRERVYTEDEAEEMFEKLEAELKKDILGENSSLNEVRNNLDFMTYIDGYGVKIAWESDHPERIDSMGNVHNQLTGETEEQVIISAIAQAGEFERRYEWNVTVLPPLLSKEEKISQAFISWVEQLDRKQQADPLLSLPGEYSGTSLIYSRPREGDYRILPVMGILFAILLSIKEQSDKKNQKKKREHQLLLDYSEIVSKMVVYIGAGLTIRGSWERIATGYEEKQKKGKKSRPAYDEIVKTRGQLNSGVSEEHAFNEFGRRCGLQPYLKLSALLEQSQKNGSRQLRSSLELELLSAFEQRKNLAKKLGEEAGTKLLFPLFLMLGVVMIMIMIPAFLSFY